MAHFWTIAAPYRGTPYAEAFASLRAACAATGAIVAASPISRVIRTEVDGCRFYVKTYTAGGKNLRRWIGRSRVRAEWENLLFFQQLGIPTAPLVAYGQEARHGIFQGGALVTAALEDARDLNTLHLEHHPVLRDSRWVRQVAGQVAEYTRRLHENRFAHLDLKWRNILVTLNGPPRVFFIDCPGGRRRFGPDATRWFLKDIACLDKVARFRLSCTRRLAFYMAYAGLERLTTGEKRKIRRIHRFFR